MKKLSLVAVLIMIAVAVSACNLGSQEVKVTQVVVTEEVVEVTEEVVVETEAVDEPEPTEEVLATPINAEALYSSNNCASCHGADRASGFAPALLPSTLTRDASVYIGIIVDGKGNMPSFSGAMNADEIAALVDWLMTVEP